MVLPDIFIDQDKPERMYEQAGLDAGGIVATKRFQALGREGDAAAMQARLRLQPTGRGKLLRFASRAF